MNSPEDVQLRSARRIVVKVGSSFVTEHGRGLNVEAIDSLVTQICALRVQGRQIVLVSSGAIAAGIQRLGWTARPTQVHELQAAAAVGQMGLAQAYETAFRRFDTHSAQVLLTHADMADRVRYLNARSTLFTLLRLGVVPVVNENDTVVTDEIKFGDNDTLGALVTNLVEADALVILTDQDGLFDADPRVNPSALLIEHAHAGDPALESVAGGAASQFSRGGMITKVLAARRAARSGAHTLIANARERSVLTRLANGERIGTRLVSTVPLLTARKQWLADQLQVRGRVVLDAGALRALVHDGKSLLPIGVTAVEGQFSRGDAVMCVDADGREVARGLVNYAADDARRIVRRPSNQIALVLGYCEEPELIHRDNLVLTGALSST